MSLLLCDLHSTYIKIKSSLDLYAACSTASHRQAAVDDSSREQMAPGIDAQRPSLAILMLKIHKYLLEPLN